MDLTERLPIEKRGMQGVWLLLAALGMFFLSSILLYVIYISMRMGNVPISQPALRLPGSFIPSTVFLIGVSGFLELACRAARRDQESQVKGYVLFALLLGMLFMVTQAEGMYRLIHATTASTSLNKSAYAFTFVLALLHALHVVAGIIGLLLTYFRASRDRYDHESMLGLKFCALYWHFLDLVWVVLLVVFIVAGVCLKRSPSANPTEKPFMGAVAKSTL